MFLLEKNIISHFSKDNSNFISFRININNNNNNEEEEEDDDSIFMC